MSFILDALKKSENARQRQLGPSLADIPLRRSRSDRPWWAVAVAGLLVVNLGVLVVVLTRSRSADEPPAEQPQIAPPVTQPPATASNAPQPAPAQLAPQPSAAMPTNPAVRSLAEEAGIEEDPLATEASVYPSLAGAATVPEGPPVVRPITPPTVTPMPNQATFAARDRIAAADNEVLPTHASVIANGTSLPDMRLDIHVYSANPAERFVFVNMRKYVEGQSLNEGPQLERITTEGAILNQRGTRFLLPRQ